MAPEQELKIENTTEDMENGELEQKILKQVEFYFSDANLPNDKFLQLSLKENNGYVPVTVIASFKRMKDLSTDITKITTVLERSELVQLNSDKTALQRKTPLPESRDTSGRVVYAKGFQLFPEPSMEALQTFFSTFGRVEELRFRRYAQPKKFKGSIFVTFMSKEDAQNCYEKRTLEYDGGEVEVTSQEAYFEQEYRQGLVPSEHINWDLLKKGDKFTNNKAITVKDVDIDKVIKMELENPSEHLPIGKIKRHFSKFGHITAIQTPAFKSVKWSTVAYQEADSAKKALEAGEKQDIEETTVSVCKMNKDDLPKYVEKYNRVRSNRPENCATMAEARSTTKTGLYPRNTVKFHIPNNDGTLKPQVRAAFGKLGELVTIELRRFHNTGYASLKNLNVEKFLAENANGIDLESGRHIDLFKVTEEEEADFLDRAKAMLDTHLIQMHLSKSEMLFPERVKEVKGGEGRNRGDRGTRGRGSTLLTGHSSDRGGRGGRGERGGRGRGGSEGRGRGNGRGNGRGREPKKESTRNGNEIPEVVSSTVYTADGSSQNESENLLGLKRESKEIVEKDQISEVNMKKAKEEEVVVPPRESIEE